ncbi:MAG: hypothetical protein ACO1OT_10515, partial [Heyndrickxia sp.]
IYIWHNHALFAYKKVVKRSKIQFLGTILWFPYFVLFVYIIASLFPITYEGDAPNPATGLLTIGALIIFPIYILIINFIGYNNDDRTRTTD